MMNKIILILVDVTSYLKLKFSSTACILEMMLEPSLGRPVELCQTIRAEKVVLAKCVCECNGIYALD